MFSARGIFVAAYTERRS